MHWITTYKLPKECLLRRLSSNNNDVYYVQGMWWKSYLTLKGLGNIPPTETSREVQSLLACYYSFFSSFFSYKKWIVGICVWAHDTRIVWVYFSIKYFMREANILKEFSHGSHNAFLLWNRMRYIVRVKATLTSHFYLTLFISEEVLT